MQSLPVLTLPEAATESDVEQAFVYRLLTSDTYLRIPTEAIKTKASLAIAVLDKGTHKRRYHPDYVVYADAIPLLVVEAKAPLQSVEEGFREAQLYAHEINKQFPHELNPAGLILSTNGFQLAYGRWDWSVPKFIEVRKLVPSSPEAAQLRSEFGWDALQVSAGDILKCLYPKDTYFTYEVLGENRARLTKVSNNTFSEELAPLLQRYFESTDPEIENEIIQRGYVSSDETTRYERLLENFLRDRVAPLDDRTAVVLEPHRRTEPKFTSRLSEANKLKQLPGYLQLVIGAVGSGKTTFLKRYFEYLITDELREKTIYVYFNFNDAPDELAGLNRWLCDEFISSVCDRGNLVDVSTPSKSSQYSIKK